MHSIDNTHNAGWVGAVYFLEGFVSSVPIKFLVDTGATISLLHSDVWRKVVERGKEYQLKQWVGYKLVSVNGVPPKVQRTSSYALCKPCL